MEIKHGAMAGTLESSDIMVTVLPGSDGIEIELTSSVEQYYGDSIRETMRKTLEELTLDEFKQYSDLFAEDVYAAIDLREHCAARKCRGHKKHARYGVEPCRLVLAVWILALFASHTAAVLRVTKYLIISKLEQMIWMVNLNIYSLYVA